MTPRLQIWCIWSIVPFVTLYIFGFVGLAGFVPPVSATLSASALAHLYDANRLGIRSGQLIALISAGFMFVWPAAVSMQMANLDDARLPVLAIVQFVAASVLATLFMLCSLIWTVAAYRPDLNPDTLRMLNDAGWLTFVMAYPEYVVQLGCIAIAGLSDRRVRPWLPRWACYLTLWVALAGIGGGFATFFKTGPFAWTGIVGFWLPVSFFLAWLAGIVLPFTLAAARRDLAATELAKATPR